MQAQQAKPSCPSGRHKPQSFIETKSTYAPRLPQQETKSSTKQLAPTDPILGPEKLLKTGFAQKGLPSITMIVTVNGERSLRTVGPLTLSVPTASTHLRW